MEPEVDEKDKNGEEKKDAEKTEQDEATEVKDAPVPAEWGCPYKVREVKLLCWRVAIKISH